jgi:hypothetical protein
MAAEHAKWWQKFGTGAQIAQAVIAALGFGAVLIQINTIGNGNRAASARQVYLAYLDLEFRNPQFAAPDYAQIKTSDRDTRLRYESFVSYLLYACEETIAAFSHQPEWLRSCELQLKSHLPFLCEKSAAEPAFLTTFSARTRAFVTSAMTQAGVAPPACQVKGA